MYCAIGVFGFGLDFGEKRVGEGGPTGAVRGRGVDGVGGGGEGGGGGDVVVGDSIPVRISVV